jgi:GNAT superfamily N-acetyltransferase
MQAQPTANDVEIRKATAADVPHLLRLFAQLDEGRREVMPLEAALSLFRKTAENPNHAIYVATLRGDVVGTFAMLVMENMAHAGAPSAIVEDVVVDEAQRSRGIGKGMMFFAMEVAGARGCYKLALSSNSKRERAHAFYRSIGFEQHGLSFQVTLQRPGVTPSHTPG